MNRDTGTGDPVLHRTTFTFDFVGVTGPAFRPVYGSVDMFSETVEVKVKLDNYGLPYPAHVRAWGKRAKKNGTASVLPAMADYSKCDYCPPHIQDVMAEALRLTRDLLKGSGEVTV